jgi:hypothetical protein
MDEPPGIDGAPSVGCTAGGAPMTARPTSMTIWFWLFARTRNTRDLKRPLQGANLELGVSAER